jgi:hypothetical protein
MEAARPPRGGNPFADIGASADVSAPNEQARTALQISAGRLRSDGRRLYRLVTPQVIWWTWVALAAFSLGDLLIQGHDYLSLKFTLGLLTLTGLVYVCTFWPRVIADDDGMTVQNPFRRFVIPWDAVRGIFLADSVEVQCARGAQKKDKSVYSWALSAARRGRSKSRLRGWQWEPGRRNTPSGYGRMPESAKELVKMSQTEIMARELAMMFEEAKARRGAVSAGHDDEPSLGDASANGFSDASVNGLSEASVNGFSANGTGQADALDAARAGAGFADVVTSTWAWPALAAILVPGIAFAIAMLVG